MIMSFGAPAPELPAKNGIPKTLWTSLQIECNLYNTEQESWKKLKTNYNVVFCKGSFWRYLDRKLL